MNTPIAEVTSYSALGGSTASLLTHTLTTADGLVPDADKVYGFQFRARNSIGDSDFSLVLRVALGAQQLAPQP